MKFAVLMWLAFLQGPDTPATFVIADVHVSPKSVNRFPRITPARGGRFEAKNASMVDLIRFAYNFDADKILGGPSWLEMDRFDIIAKAPPDTSPEMRNEMLQSLLAERFKLVVHKEVKPLPTHALVVGKKPQLKDADGSEESACKPQGSSSANAPPNPNGGGRLFMNLNGVQTVIDLGPGNTVTYICRNMSMDSFVMQLRSMVGASVGQNPILQETGLKGKYNFELRYSMGMGFMPAENSGRISVQEAIDKQLGLKLEERQVPTPVLVVDKVNQKPTENSPELAKELPPIAMPTEFEVASVKPAAGDMRSQRRFSTQPGGKLVVEGMPLRTLLMRAFNANNSEQIADVPGFADTERFDITAKAASSDSTAPAMDTESMAPLILSLMKERFKLAYHKDERPVTAYTLVAAKPKMKKADPASRTSCQNAGSAPGVPPMPAERILICKNATMALLAEQLQGADRELQWPVADATGLEGGWDFTLYWSQVASMNLGGRGGGADAGAMPSASDPNSGYTLIEAIEKELGLKLEKQKRTMPVIVIDHLEQKATDN
jgi:uncharacterized protein (TIGR03435 family)